MLYEITLDWFRAHVSVVLEPRFYKHIDLNKKWFHDTVSDEAFNLEINNRPRYYVGLLRSSDRLIRSHINLIAFANPYKVLSDHELFNRLTEEQKRALILTHITKFHQDNCLQYEHICWFVHHYPDLLKLVRKLKGLGILRYPNMVARISDRKLKRHVVTVNNTPYYSKKEFIGLPHIKCRLPNMAGIWHDTK